MEKKYFARACLRLNVIQVWDHSIPDCRCEQTTTEQKNTFERNEFLLYTWASQ